MPHQKICEHCKSEFVTLYQYQKYCGKKCRTAKSSDKKTDTTRKITPLTVYLVHKWAFEGMTVDGIAKTFGCTKARVLTALGVPLTATQEQNMRRFLIRR